MITVFTPTYNRASYLKTLYDSLKKQQSKNFCWVIVDDGSVDETEKIVQEFIRESNFGITYYKQINQGKHVAINKGLELTNTDFFFIVDSDDYLTSDAIEVIEQNLPKIEDNTFCGLIFNRVYPNGKVIGGENKIESLQCSLYDLKFKFKLNSDKAEVFKTKVLREFPFPQFKNEKFCPEALIMYRMSGPYEILYVNKGIYIGEYLEGGLTSSIVKVRMKNPKASTLYYKEHFFRGQDLIEKAKCAINFYRFQANDLAIKNEIPFPFSLLKIFGKFMYYNDKSKMK